MPKLFLFLAAANGFLSVALGAFAAHGLSARLSEQMLATFQTGVQYHMYHTLALFGVGVLSLHYPGATLLRYSGFLFLAGTLIFSGSLYILALSGIRWLGAITPIGGVAFLAGWAALAWFALSEPLAS
ncbi:MAG: DUF423 domain-containing protein [Gammaproteobacteria bacterium]|jgi:uncharacterized membrane protein YgdD (TMEM256/DUF423 family)